MTRNGRRSADDDHSSTQHAEVEHWIKQVRDLPDLRLDKVLASRTAIRHDQYDDDAVLDATVERLYGELGELGSPG